MLAGKLSAPKLNPVLAHAQDKAVKKPVDESQINRINKRIDKKQDDIKDTAKEMQEAIVNNEKDKGQLLQNMMLMKQWLEMKVQIWKLTH